MSKNSEISYRSASNKDGEAIRALVFGVLGEYGLQPDINGIDLDLFDIEANYPKRGGLFEVLINREGSIVGSVGLYPLEKDIVELRKMYFDESIRGKGLGKYTLRRVIDKAKSMGFKRVVLETASPLIEAIGLYKSFGFSSTEGTHADRCDQAFYLDL
jgi:putative acetyltransferase